MIRRSGTLSMAETQKRSQKNPKTQRAHKAPWTRKKRKSHGRETKKRLKPKAVRLRISVGTTAAFDEQKEELGEKGF